MKNRIFAGFFLVGMSLFLLQGSLFGCTMFNATKNGRTLVGNNEDWEDPYTKVWFEPAGNGKYGRVYFGYRNLIPQGGMNDQGLVFDGFWTPYLKLEKARCKEKLVGYFFIKAMEQCATVEEVIALYHKYDLQGQGLERAQYMFVDKKGDSVIVEGDKIFRKTKPYQVVTNFYLSRLKEEDKIPCDRYKTVLEMLPKMEISLENFGKILAATHVETDRGGTQYSNIYDVNRGLVYLYHFHNFASPVVINLSVELKKGKRVIDIHSLFPKNLSFQSYLKFYNHRKKKAVKIDPQIYEQYVGKYQWKDGTHTWIKKIKNRLIILTGNIYELYPLSETEFMIKEYDAGITFVKKKLGKVSKLIFRNRNRSSSAKKIM